MPRDVQHIIADFEQLAPTENDFNDRGRLVLRDLCNEVLDTPEPSLAIPAMLNVIEKFPEADFGAPGVLVHTLEKISGYEGLLIESIQRRPAPLALIMLSRLRNSTTDETQKSAYRAVFQGVIDNPSTSAEAKEIAASFLG
jgi:hypothetical protein